MTTNHKIVLANRPNGEIQLTDFRLVEETVRAPGPGHVVVAAEVLSIDAYIRTMLDESAFHGSTLIGGTVAALGVGKVVKSSVEQLQPGDVVFGGFGAQTMPTLPAAGLRKLDVSKRPATTYLGALNVATGYAAYFGVVDVGAVKTGETVVVSGAAGAVGSLAGQIARIAGATKVIGIAGGPHKVEFLVDELGFDAGIDYKNEDVEQRIGELAPEGIDVFYDNVGGDILDAALMHIKEGSRVVICGGISQYQHLGNVTGPRNYLKLAERRARMEGFAVNHMVPRYGEAEAALTKWIDEGRLKMHEQYEHGIDRFPHALLALFSGGHMGKFLLDVT